MPEDPRSGLFPALLKYWRGQRGLSQLDLAVAADVSSRHISFLETARAAPSVDMVVRLGRAMDVPLRHLDALLRSAGHEAQFGGAAEPALSTAMREALELLKRHHEPYPLIVIDRAYDVVDANQGATTLLGATLGRDLGDGLNLMRVTFDPEGAQPLLVNFDQVGRSLLWRLQREVLSEPGDSVLRDLLTDVLAMPTVSDDWRSVDLGTSSDPALALHFRVGEAELRFYTLITAFQAPQNVSADELRIEHWLPADAATADLCRQMTGWHNDRQAT